MMKVKVVKVHFPLACPFDPPPLSSSTSATYPITITIFPVIMKEKTAKSLLTSRRRELLNLGRRVA